MHALIRPPKLKPGDRLGIITTSTPIQALDEAAIARAYQRLAALGLEAVEAPNCRLLTGHTAGTVEARVQALHDLLQDPSIHGIMAFWGGYQTHQLLERLDWALFARYPKPIIGYSDLTPLLNTITFKSGLITFSGPAVITFAKPTLFEDTTRCFQNVLFHASNTLQLEPPAVVSTNLWFKHDDKLMIERPSEGWKTFQPGLAQGRLWGGNLGSLLLLSGTPYWPELRDAILFVEEDESETPQTIDRLFTQLRQMGVFQLIRGLIIGRFPDSVAFSAQDSFEAILQSALHGYDLPVLYDVDLGHTDPILTLPLGILAELDATHGRITLLEPWCSGG